jgi:archaeosine synthase
MLALRNCKNPMVVHEVIVTSPLGIVPRELELVYPAQHYDIPVTGTWYEEEKSVIRTQLNWLIENFDYRRIIAHVNKELYFIGEGLEHVEFTGGDKPTSKSSLDKLTETLNDSVADCPIVKPSERRLQMVTTMAVFHFGKDTGHSLMEDVDFRGSYPYLKIMHKGSQLGMIEASTGLISLTLAGGERILNTDTYGVEIDEFELKGDIFAPGVLNAGPIIRPNDEVVVFSKSRGERKLKAVGRAALSGNEMVEANNGRAVKVRHYVK